MASVAPKPSCTSVTNQMVRSYIAMIEDYELVAEHTSRRTGNNGKFAFKDSGCCHFGNCYVLSNVETWVRDLYMYLWK